MTMMIQFSFTKAFDNSKKGHLPTKADIKKTKTLKMRNKKNNTKYAIRTNYIYLYTEITVFETTWCICVLNFLKPSGNFTYDQV
jgi:hypothetical protein